LNKIKTRNQNADLIADSATMSPMNNLVGHSHEIAIIIMQSTKKLVHGNTVKLSIKEAQVVITDYKRSLQ